jgi:cell division ATPase FtsA
VVSKHVRLGRPARLIGLPDAAGSAPFAACAGLASWAAQRPDEVQKFREETDLSQLAYASSSASQGFAGIKRWFKENF